MTTTITNKKLLLLIPAVATLVFATVSTTVRPAYAATYTVSSFLYGSPIPPLDNLPSQYAAVGTNSLKFYANQPATSGSTVSTSAYIYHPVYLTAGQKIKIISATAGVYGNMYGGDTTSPIASSIASVKAFVSDKGLYQSPMTSMVTIFAKNQSSGSSYTSGTFTSGASNEVTVSQSGTYYITVRANASAGAGPTYADFGYPNTGYGAYNVSITYSIT